MHLVKQMQSHTVKLVCVFRSSGGMVLVSITISQEKNYSLLSCGEVAIMLTAKKLSWLI